ncbi:hypothetical protein [Picrophilus oshimae]|uniref:Uncharacterized protein n=1 Tax=Picrophilus torridus (strain ATCC 700027 / DSM 9790 / JCM 10055 / NBRC 100828 / KAW 2/3) TaxID=1122961 RepID=Q6L1W5_PICTO|nr:hypothetical protein [Picrophilus oshimae]AAT43037.1 hypothetical protein PTO0452 [Picrophilus oshimae DSM 9789]
MPVKSDDIKSRGGDAESLITSFLEKNSDSYFTLKEISESTGIDIIELHVIITMMLWSGRIKYRDIYDHENKLRRYYAINK